MRSLLSGAAPLCVALMLLTGCGSGSGDGAVAVAPEPTDVRGGLCATPVDRGSALLRSGAAADRVNTGNQPSAIHAGNVARLEPHFVHVAAGAREKRGAPAMTEQAIFLAAGRDVVAIDRRSGCEYWRHSVERRPDGAGPTRRDNVLRSASILHEPARDGRPPVVAAADAYGHVHVLDATDGRPLWSAFVGTEPGAHRVTGGMQIHDGVLLVPLSSSEVGRIAVELLQPCCRTHGILAAVDLYDGTVRWRHHTTGEASFQLGSGQFAPSGAAIWSTPAIDAARNRVYIGTGQNFSRPTTETSNAIIALDLDSGEQLWHFQSTPDDAWNVSCETRLAGLLHCARPAGPDFDFGAPPILTAMPGGGDVIIAGAKNGTVYALNPDTGALRWSRPVGRGGALGGIHWGMAVDGERVYAAVSDTTIRKKDAFRSGESPGLAEMQQVEGATSGIYALDLRNGNVLWSHHPQHRRGDGLRDSIHSAAVTVTNDVLFAGSLDGVLRALHVHDGRELWSFDSDIAVRGVNGVDGEGGEIDSAAPVIADDTLLLNSGYATFGGADAYKAGPGNALFVFRLAE